MQLLIHGVLYNRHYFDLPYQPDTDSYARAANRAGYATLAIDRLGVGASLHPLSLFHTLQADIRTVHEVVQALRNGSLGTPFAKVIAVGHSLGSVIAAQEAGIYRDVDALITTGYAHVPNVSNIFIEILGGSHLASGDPKFAGSGLDPGYLTSQPGTRARTFYHIPNADPAVFELDETLLKDTGTLTEAVTFALYPVNNVDRTLDIPVLVVNGDRDRFFCGLNTADCTSSGSLAAHERQFYAPDASVEALVIENTGHAIHLERTAPLANEAMIAFAERHVGHGRGQVGAEPGTRPAPAIPPQDTPSPLPRAASAAFMATLVPLADAYRASVQPVPGLGDVTNPNPASAVLLSRIANLANRVLGDSQQRLLEGDH